MKKTKTNGKTMQKTPSPPYKTSGQLMLEDLESHLLSCGFLPMSKERASQLHTNNLSIELVPQKKGNQHKDQ